MGNFHSRFWLIFPLGIIWFLLWIDWASFYLAPTWIHGIAFAVFAGLAGFWFWKARKQSVVARCAIASVVFITGWQLLVFGAAETNWIPGLARILSKTGLVTIFLAGLAWSVFFVEVQSRRLRKLAAAGPPPAPAGEGSWVWNPFNLDAWFFRSDNRKLDQSLFTFLSYSLIFILLFLILTKLGSCREIYELPAGGGEPKQQQVVKIQKVIKKKIVINPFSSIIFNPPPIEDIELKLTEITEHKYEVGYGEGKGAGFKGGTNRGKVRFIRLEYQGGDWDQDFGGSSDLNILIEYNARTGQQIAERTESRRISDLENFPIGKSPPMVYMTGQKSIIVSKSEVETLREYLL
ncbi:MAG: hypothetical protein ACI8UO_006507, partial [Verrucomicrobiales bacterium]